MQNLNSNQQGFTLMELLIVIAIIVILMGLLFPAFKGVQDQAKRTQAKNDLTQIVTAVNAFTRFIPNTESIRRPLQAATQLTDPAVPIRKTVTCLNSYAAPARRSTPDR